MRIQLIFTAVVALFASSIVALAPVLHTGSSTVIPDQFIVVLKPLSRALRDAHVTRVQALLPADSKVRRFEIGSKFSGYGVKLLNSTLAAVRAMPEVQFIEADQVVTANGKDTCSTQSSTPSWGLDRIAEQALFLDGKYTYPTTAAKGVYGYIIDTGIYIQHSDFGGRATWGTNTVDDDDTDCNGHGTHVAGTVGGTKYGVAKQVHLVAVKVLNCAGSGTNTGVIDGIQWVAEQHQARRATATASSVANLSLGGAKSTAVNAAVAAAVGAGVVMVVAAGNSNTDACNTSPASEPLAVTVGATDVGISASNDQIDVRSSFSNYGKCVTVFAPGSDITSAWIGGPTAQNTISGTSMASPHVAGVAALLLQANPGATAAEIKDKIASSATTGLLDLQCSSAACRASPDKIAYNAC